MKEVNYKYYKVPYISLDQLYLGNAEELEKLSDTIASIIVVEAPITLNMLKARLRDAFQLKKISQKALDIIEDILNKKSFPTTDNLFDKVYWPVRGIFNIDYIRQSDRQIYDIPKEEMKCLVLRYMQDGYHGEELYRKVLSYFGYEVLTAKALEYLQFVEKYCKN